MTGQQKPLIGRTHSWDLQLLRRDEATGEWTPARTAQGTTADLDDWDHVPEWDEVESSFDLPDGAYALVWLRSDEESDGVHERVELWREYVGVPEPEDPQPIERPVGEDRSNRRPISK